MNLNSRFQKLKALFSYESPAVVDDTGISIIPCGFSELTGFNELGTIQKLLPTSEFCTSADASIAENRSFKYIVFTPQGTVPNDEAIVMLHGLNESSWDKYLTWAERLAASTGRSVVLFPIAFHMNRAPGLWHNPRYMTRWSLARRAEMGDQCNSTYLNAALSIRMGSQPLRFYMSGLETVHNVRQLVGEIKSGRHPLFKEGASVNIFSYSIGALIAQVIMMADPGQLFTSSRLFMFCGGSVFSMMNGSARDILDKPAFDRLNGFYTTDFLSAPYWMTSPDNVTAEKAFRTMITDSCGRAEREAFFTTNAGRIRAVSLAHDSVVPTVGVRQALGGSSEQILRELDFPFEYSHQSPFPSGGRFSASEVEAAFDDVFDRACSFL